MMERVVPGDPNRIHVQDRMPENSRQMPDNVLPGGDGDSRETYAEYRSPLRKREYRNLFSGTVLLLSHSRRNFGVMDHTKVAQRDQRDRTNFTVIRNHKRNLFDAEIERSGPAALKSGGTFQLYSYVEL